MSLHRCVTTKTSIFKYPAVITELLAMKKLKTRPAPSRKPTAYLGGKIYTRKSPSQLRVYSRIADALEQSVPIDWTDKTSVDKSWRIACGYIESDTRK